MSDAKTVLAMIKEHDVKYVDLRFTDPRGKWHHTAQAVKTIDEIFAVMEKDSQDNGQAFQDIQGDVYEMLLAEIATAGKNGQFRTPRHIIKLMAELVQPQLGTDDND